MPKYYTFSEIVAAFDTGVAIENTNGAAFAFLDGSGDDTINYNDLSSWHTFSLFCSNVNTLISTDLISSWPLAGETLRKWTGQNPAIPDDNPQKARRDKYRRDIMGELASHSAQPLWIRSWSYRGRHLIARKDAIYQYFGISKRQTEDGVGHVTRTDRKGRTVSYVRFVLNEPEVVMLEASFLIIFEIAYRIVTFYGDIRRSIGGVNGLMIITDPLLGDGLKKNNKHGSILASILNNVSAKKLNLRTVEMQNSRIGEMIADNIAGLLNGALKKDAINPCSDHLVRSLRAAPKCIFNWYVYGDGGATFYDNEK